jgi:hypothetical protein
MFKKVFVSLIMLVCFVAICQTMEIPNLETTYLYSKMGSQVGLTSKILSIKDIDFRVGKIIESEVWLASIGFEIKKFEKLGADVVYAWDGLADLSLGIWGGYNFTTGERLLGVNAVLLKFEFGGKK